ncbi:MAG: response regulator transcription factor [Verrucomicrobia bacterium]|nr:response regulator transcription factor [Verrucomicrobiota bacterium]
MSTKQHTRGRTKPTPRVAGLKTADTNTPAKRRVLLVDDHPITREGLGIIISRQADLEVCCEACNPAEAMSVLSRSKPDLMVTDMTMPGRSGFEFLKDVHAMMPELPMLVLSMHDEVLYAERALRAGARGYLMKDAGAAKVLEVIRLVLSGEAYVSPQISARLLDAMSGRRPRGSASPIEKLSDREFEIFQLVGQGKSTREIAKQLNLSPKTVDAHRGHLKEKLELKDATSLVRHAVRWVETQDAAPSQLVKK